jgi:hypothetical protein
MLEKVLCDKINYISKTSPEKLDLMKRRVKNYADLLKKNRLTDKNFAAKLDFNFFRYLALVTGFPVFVAGYLSNLIPFLIPRIICNRLIKDPRFYSSVYLSSGTVLYLIYFPVILILATVFLGWIGFLLGLMVPLAGYMVLFYQEIFSERMQNLRFIWTKTLNPPLIKELSLQRKSIIEELDNIEMNS